MMHIVYQFARDCTLVDKYRMSGVGSTELALIQLINSVSQSPLSQVTRPVKKVITVANLLSNLEPTITLSSGNILSLQNVRTRLTYQPSEIEFVQTKIWDMVKPFQLGTQSQVFDAVTHLLTGEQLTTDITVYKQVLAGFQITDDPVMCICRLVGYAKGFNCASVEELSNLTASHYVDRGHEAIPGGTVKYLTQGVIRESLVY